MRSDAARAALGIAVLALAVALLLVLRDDGGGETAPDAGAPGAGAPGESRSEYGSRPQRPEEPAVPAVRVRGGEPVGGVAELSFRRGERIRFRVFSDVVDEVHVHGYDVSREVEAGGSVGFDFPATIEGIFEVELERRAAPIAELRVDP